jgi:hypothetical protein
VAIRGETLLPLHRLARGYSKRQETAKATRRLPSNAQQSLQEGAGKARSAQSSTPWQKPCAEIV